MTSRKGTFAKPSKPVLARPLPTPRGVEPKKVVSATRPLPRSAPQELDPLRYVRSLIREIPDFPQPGVLFKDITPLIADPKAFHIVLDAIAHHFVGERVDAVVGVESRGFIFGGALAARLNASFVPVRKPGKLPYRTDKVSYSLEYGEAELEMHRDSLKEGAAVLVVDDLLATGGTAAAAGELVHRQGAFVVAYAFVIELVSLGGRERLLPTPATSIVKYE
ncbi:MAG TPA: adenine phosphoribosyltransferase [Polyangiaceae bacterium]|jgi:adenine phosphoribosyltransferase|nr:adenine phosphoribosyltransferase [Polyangiaceae bacterium]